MSDYIRFQASAPTVVFRTPGILDPRSFQVFGLHAKPESGGTAIGQFGTGLKYTIAIAMRYGWDLRILSFDAEGEQTHYSFRLNRTDFRGQEFQGIEVFENGHKAGILPFTTDLGKHWLAWMAYRELESNTRDEKGTTEFLPEGEYSALYQNQTIIAVSGDEFTEAYNNRAKYFLSDAILDAPDCYHGPITDIIPLQTHQIYYRGIQVMELSEDQHPFLNLYNLKSQMSLSEDRTLTGIYTVQSEIAQALALCEDEELCYRTITCGKDFFEGHIDFADRLEYACPASACSSEFKSAAQRALQQKPHSLNRSIIKHLSYKSLDDRFVTKWTPDGLEQDMLERANAFLNEAGYDVTSYPIICVDITTELAGVAKDGSIYLTRLAFSKGISYLASTILEEFFHLRYQHHDHTPAFQDFLHDEILRQAQRRLGKSL